MIAVDTIIRLPERKWVGKGRLVGFPYVLMIFRHLSVPRCDKYPPEVFDNYISRA